MNGASIEEAMKKASAASAIAVSELGAAESIPTYLQVKEFINEKKNNELIIRHNAERFRLGRSLTKWRITFSFQRTY